MRMSVRDRDDEVHIELTGVAGRQQNVLQALSQLRDGLPPSRGEPRVPAPATMAVRAGANGMYIRVTPHAADLPLQTVAIYRWMRQALVEQPAARAAAEALAVPG
jgi:hypothetical protein